MDADLDLLLIAVFCAADDLLPKAAKNAKRILTDEAGPPRGLAHVLCFCGCVSSPGGFAARGG